MEEKLCYAEKKNWNYVIKPFSIQIIHNSMKFKTTREMKKKTNQPWYWHLRSRFSITFKQIGSSSTARTRIPTGNGSVAPSSTTKPPLWPSTVIRPTNFRDPNENRSTKQRPRRKSCKLWDFSVFKLGYRSLFQQPQKTKEHEPRDRTMGEIKRRNWQEREWGSM